MTTADYALIVSLVSALVSLTALLWNVWQKYIFVKPALQVGFGVFTAYHPGPDEIMIAGEQRLNLTVTNMGPGPVIIHSCIGRPGRWDWRLRRTLGVLTPIHGDPFDPNPRGIGPFGGGLPAKIDAAECKSFFFPFSEACFLNQSLERVGVCDTYGRYSWCRRRDYKRAVKHWRDDFKSSVAS